MLGVGTPPRAREGEPCMETRWLLARVLAWVITRACAPDARQRERFVGPYGLLDGATPAISG